MKTMVLPQQRLKEIVELGKARAPVEACGILLPADLPWNTRYVWELPNRSLEPGKFLYFADDVQITLAKWFERYPDRWNDLALWHTHTEQIGPSEADLENRIDDVGNLVITLGPPVKATWY